MAKNYSVKIENDEVISIEIDGVQYDNLDQIPDPDDRDKILALMVDPSNPDSDFPDMDWEAPESNPVLPKIFLGVFLGIAILMFAIAAISAFSTARGLAREQSAPGRVVDMVVRVNEEGNEFYYPVVEFSLPDESRRTVQTAEGSWPPAYEKGDPVTVAYDPERPLNARIRSLSSAILMWTLPMITGFLGLAFLAATLLARWVFKSTPTETKPE